MKKSLFIGFAFVAISLGTAFGETFRARVDTTREQPARRPPAPIYARPVAGAIPRAVRGGNPLQMFNPRAPQKYRGSPDDTVTYDQNNPSRITGIILFGIRW